MGFALSTSWNAFRHKNGREMLFEIERLGFKEIELSFNLTPSMVEDCLEAVKSGRFKAVSLHNYCPIPGGLKREAALPDCYSMASCDEEERGLALNYTKQTIDTAKRFGSRAVVLHCGRVEMVDKTRELINLYQKGLKATEAFAGLREEMVSQRKKFYKPFLENTLSSLQELSAYARGRGVSLGIETRYYFREIPSFEEIGIILDKLDSPDVFYWHDTGHAQLMENLGFYRHREFLEAYGSRMCGVHLHNISCCSDHQAPHKGEFDFSLLKPFVTAQTLKVIEAHHPATAGDLTKSREFLKAIFNGRP